MLVCVSRLGLCVNEAPKINGKYRHIKKKINRIKKRENQVDTLTGFLCSKHSTQSVGRSRALSL